MLLLEGHAADVTALAFAPDGSRLASASWDGTIRLWPLSGGPALVLRTGNDHALAVAIAPDGAHLAAGFRSRRPSAPGHDFGNLAYIPLLPSPDRGEIGIRHIDTWFAYAAANGPESIAFCPTDGSILATAGVVGNDETHDAALRLYRMPQRELIALMRPSRALRSIAFCPDGEEIAAVSRRTGQGLFAWSVRGIGNSKRELVELEAPYHCPAPNDVGAAVCYVPDGQTIVGAFHSGLVVWWTPGEEPQWMATGHARGALRSIAFSPDGRQFVTGGRDGLAKLWDGASRRLVHTFDWQLGDIHCVAFATDGLTIAAGGHGPIVIWDV